MYNELYAAWRREIDEASLGHLPPDFYARIADYLRQIREENKMLDKKSIKVNLLEHETQNVKLMLKELIWLRYKKLIKTIARTQKLPSEMLAVEEAKMGERFAAFTDAFQRFSKDLMHGQTAKLEMETEVSHKRLVLRFKKSIPAIIGADMKLYGPFAAEDVASLPVENAKILVKQDLAALVEVS